MVKKIDFGKTSFKDLYQVFKYTNQEEFENKRSRLFPNGNSDNYNNIFVGDFADDFTICYQVIYKSITDK